MFIKNTLALICFFSINITAFAQSAIIGDWKVVTTFNKSSGEVLYGSLDYAGQILHFQENGLLSIENEEGQFLSKYTLDGSTISYNGTNLLILEQTDDFLSLEFKDPVTNRHLVMELQAQKENKPKDEPAPSLFEAEKYGDFKTKGVYFRYAEKQEKYIYLRILPDGRFLSTNSKLPPEEVVHFLNGAYIYRNKRQLILNTKNYQNNIVSGVNLKENKSLVTEVSFQVSEGEDKLIRYSYSQNTKSKKKAPRTSTETYSFYPTKELAYWIPKQYAEEEEEKCPFLNSLLFAPEPSKEVFNVVSQMPMFPCQTCSDPTSKAEADKAMLQYIYQNIRYPAEARNASIQGTVVIQFVINEDGSISDSKVLRSIGGGCGEEAVRVVNQMNTDGIKWEPGRSGGVPVKVNFNLPIKFRTH